MSEESVRAEDEAELRKRAVAALLNIGWMSRVAGEASLDAALASKALAELVEYLSTKFVMKWAPERVREVTHGSSNFATQAAAAAHLAEGYLKEMHELAAKYRGAVLQDSVVLEVKNIEEATANSIADWLDGHAAAWRRAATAVLRLYPDTPSADGPQQMMALTAEATAKQIREGEWRSQKKGG